MIRTFWAAALAGAALATTAWASGAGDAPQPMLGFSADQAQAQRALEARFDAGLSADDIRARLQRMSSQPNQVGSPHDRENAEYVLGLFKSWGWDARIETFQVLYPTPISETLELVGPQPYAATLTERGIAGDTSAVNRDHMLPAWVAFGADGDVTADLVYVNYGMPDDYKVLDRMGISVAGKIVIARYGGGWRGLKPKLAQEHGAVGCIIYSDPADDGYGEGATYPTGSWRPPQAFQRGSVVDMTLYAGDPLTPGVGATRKARRLTVAEARTVLKIPVLPIAYAEAQHFLAALDGRVVPANWRGALPITYRTGPGPAKVHLATKADWSLKTIYDVIAVMKGSESPDQWVVRGNHRDGWVYGAEDPLSGQTAMLEEAKSLGALARTGWRPKRTLVYASWDAEEPGLIGSTEWAEAHAADLQRKAVIYINSDSNSRGVLQPGGSYSLARLIDQTARDIRDPETGATVRDRARASIQADGFPGGASEGEKALARLAADNGDLPIAALGSGSDYTPFLQHLGIASIDLGYGGEGEGGVYHSAYDTFEHYARFGDPSFQYEVALAQTGGRLVMRMADAEILPFRFTTLATRVADNVSELRKMADTMREHDATLNRLLDEHAFELASDPTRPMAPPPREAAVPAIAFERLDQAVAKLKASAERYDAAAAAATGLDAKRRKAVNAILQRMEQSLTNADGLPGRDWFKHLVYAPGKLTGYGVKTIPGVREAIEGRRWEEADAYIGKTAAALEACAARLDEATAKLGG